MTEARRIQIGGDHYVAKAIQPWDAMRAWAIRKMDEVDALAVTVRRLMEGK